MAETLSAVVFWLGAVALSALGWRFVFYVVHEVPWRVIALPRVFAGLALVCALAGVASAFAAPALVPGYSIVTQPSAVAPSLAWSADADEVYAVCDGPAGNGVLSGHALPNSTDCAEFFVNVYGVGASWSPGPYTWGVRAFNGDTSLRSAEEADAAAGSSGGGGGGSGAYEVTWQDSAELSALVVTAWALAFSARLLGSVLRGAWLSGGDD